MFKKTYYVYILASERNGTLYVGVTNSVIRRTTEHKRDVNPGFSRHHKVHTLVYYESFTNILNAIAREKALKKWNRKWKLRLIEEMNPTWKDLYWELVD